MRKLNITYDKDFYRTLLRLYIPLTLQSLFMYAVTTIDSIMLGSLGEVAIAAANLANQPFILMSGVVRGLILGGGVLIAQYWGKQDLVAIRKIITIGIKISVAISAFCAIVVFILPAQVMGIFSTDVEVIAAGKDYLRIMACMYVLYAVSNVFVTSLRSVENTKTTFIVSLITYSFNVLLDYCLIFGAFGLPEMGIIGVAVGTVIARILEFVLYIGIIYKKNNKLGLKIKEAFFKMDRILLGDFVKYGLPSMGSETLFVFGFTLYNVIFGRLGTVAAAAYSMTYNITQVNKMLVMGLGSASAVIIGKCIGSGALDKVKIYVRTFNVIVFVLGLAQMLTLFVTMSPLANLYGVTSDTKDLVIMMCIMAGVTMIGFGYEVVYVTGMQVGSGDTKNIFIYATSIMYFVTLPLAFLAAFVWNFEIEYVYLIIMLDYTWKGFYGYYRTKGTKWIKTATRDNIS